MSESKTTNGPSEKEIQDFYFLLCGLARTNRQEWVWTEREFCIYHEIRKRLGAIR